MKEHYYTGSTSDLCTAAGKEYEIGNILILDLEIGLEEVG
jgi:ribosomal protein L30E